MAIKVSIYDDNDALLESLSLLIRETERLELYTASPSAINVIAQCQEKYPDIILMDLEMPALSGIEATRLVKKHFPDIHVLILAVFEDRERLFKVLSAGAAGYLLKKTPAAQIIEAIMELYRGGSLITSGVANKMLIYFSKPVFLRKRTGIQLSRCERTILKRLRMGDTYKMAADACSIDISAVYTQINAIYKKLQANVRGTVRGTEELSSMKNHINI